MSVIDNLGVGSESRLRDGEPWAWALGLLALIGLAIPVGLFSDLNTVCGPTLAGTVSADATEPTLLWLELAGLRDRAPAVLESYRSRGVMQCARMAIGADGMFIVIYAAGLLIATFLVARAWDLAGSAGISRMLRRMGIILVLAAGLDFAENLGMLRLLRDPPELDLALRTGWCSGMKFAGLGLVLAVLAVGGLIVPFRSARRHQVVATPAFVVGLMAVAMLVAIVVGVGRAWQSMPGG